MSKIVKKMKIMQPGGTLSNYVPIGAEAENINVDGESVETKLSKKPYYYNSVADMKADTKLKAGDMAVTLGYYAANDGGGAEYKIVNASSQNEYQETIGDLYATLIVSTVLNIKQFGAKGDNETDNLSIFTIAISYCNSKKIILYIPSGTYIISASLNIPAYMTIKGENQENSILKFNSNGLIFDNVNFCNISNIFIKGSNNTNYGIYMKGSSVHNINFENVLIYDFACGIYSDATQLWNGSYKNMRIGTCTKGMDIYQGFNLSFINFYIDRCGYIMELDRLKATTFIGSNFSIINGEDDHHVITAGANCNIVFDSCNFECDVQYTKAHMFELSSRMLKFINCNFIMNCTSTSHVFLLYNTFRCLIFENCSYTTKTENEMPDANFWDKSYFNSATVGGIKFLTPDDIPRPSGLYSQQYQYYHDIGNGLPINFYGTSINTALLSKGTLLFQRDTNTLCLFDGINVVKVSDGTIII